MSSVPADEEIVALVRRLAREHGVSEAEVVAAAVREYLDRQGGGATDPEVPGDGPAPDLD